MKNHNDDIFRFTACYLNTAISKSAELFSKLVQIAIKDTF